MGALQTRRCDMTPPRYRSRGSSSSSCVGSFSRHLPARARALSLRPESARNERGREKEREDDVKVIANFTTRITRLRSRHFSRSAIIQTPRRYASFLLVPARTCILNGFKVFGNERTHNMCVYMIEREGLETRRI